MMDRLAINITVISRKNPRIRNYPFPFAISLSFKVSRTDWDVAFPNPEI